MGGRDVVSAAERPSLFGEDIRRIHAIGVGGMGVGPLAIYLARRGFVVTGEDDALSSQMSRHLKQAGVKILSAGAVPDESDLVVYSSAVGESHPSYRAAENLDVTCRRRGEVLAELSRSKRLVAICGSHGKTTATAMLVAALQRAGRPIDYVLGGLFADASQPPAAANDSEWLVAEVDESDGTIDGFEPTICTVLNLDWDHADRYASSEVLVNTFSRLVTRTKTHALIGDGVKGLTCASAERVGSATRSTFGRRGDYRLTDTTSRDGRGISQKLELTGKFSIESAMLNARGDFNAMNAVAALATAQLIGAEMRGDLLGEFTGVHRRQALLRDDAQLTVIEDYAHHPTEIRALLDTLRADLDEGRRLVVVFQPHRYSRTRQFKTELADSLRPADSLHLLDVYAAGETPIEGGRTENLFAELMTESPERSVNYAPGDADAVLSLLKHSRRPGDMVVFVGAGDIEHHAQCWVDEVAKLDEAAGVWDAVADEMRDATSEETKIVREEMLASKTTMRVGGAARIYVEPRDLSELQVILRICAKRELAVHYMGRGSNLLVPDAGVEGVVVSLRHPSWASFEKLDDSRVKVGAGLRLKNLCGLAAKEGLTGFEFLEGVPGNVGGALRMNAGAMGGWMFDVVESVEAVSLDGTTVHFDRDDLHFGYRHCRELEETMAVGAVLVARGASETDSVARQIDVYRCKRQESQPRLPSAGCIFKNPPDDSAGRLIDSCGLKGQSRGDAQVSTVHGNFIVNRGHAGSEDVVNLVRHVRSEVKRLTQIELEPEVLLYGANWKELL